MACDDHHRPEARCSLLIAGRYATELLEQADTALNHVEPPVGISVEAATPLVQSGLDRRADAASAQDLSAGRITRALVGQDLARTVPGSSAPDVRHPIAVEYLPNCVLTCRCPGVRTRERGVNCRHTPDVVLPLPCLSCVRAPRLPNVGPPCFVRLTLATLERAIRTRQPRPGLIHHSDQGVQYASDASVDRLDAAGVQISMATVGNPYENAKAERFFRTLKHEEVESEPVRLFHGR